LSAASKAHLKAFYPYSGFGNKTVENSGSGCSCF